MIAKFRKDDGWAFHDCVRAVVSDDGWDPSLDMGQRFVYNKHTGDGRRVALERQDGKLEIIYYDLDAYLMNDRGDTINSI